MADFTNVAQAFNPGELPKIIEMAETPDGKMALTCQWSDGDETVEKVSEKAALALGYTWPDETA